MIRLVGPWCALAAFAIAGTGCLATSGSAHDDAEIARAGVEVCASGATVPGVDVSHHNDDIDWAAVAGAGNRFAFIKFAQGAKHDPLFDQNWQGAGQAGMLR